MKSGVYRINLANGLFYVGSSKHLDKRRWHHQSNLRSGKHPNQHMTNSFNKHGVFEFAILELCPENELLQKEQELLDKHFGDPKFVNVCPVAGRVTGRPRTPPSDEWKKAQSLKQKGRKLPPRNNEWCENIAKSAKASPLVMSQIEKLHDAQKGKSFTEEHKQNLRIARKAYFDRKRSDLAVL